MKALNLLDCMENRTAIYTASVFTNTKSKNTNKVTDTEISLNFNFAFIVTNLTLR